MRKVFMTFFVAALLSLTFIACNDNKKESGAVPSLNNSGGEITPAPASANVNANANLNANGNVSVTSLNVLGMTCGRCVNAITNALRKNPDVKNVAVDVRGATVTVTHDPNLAESEIRRIIIEDAGYNIGNRR